VVADPEWSKLPETLTGLGRADQKARAQSKADCDREQRRETGKQVRGREQTMITLIFESPDM
jgi:hypothetical protein